MPTAQEIIARRREMDRLSTVLFDAGAGVIRRNPKVMAIYVVGLLVMFFFSGFTPTREQEYEAHTILNESQSKLADLSRLRSRRAEAYTSFKSRQGFFWTCDADCTRYKREYEKLDGVVKSSEGEVDRIVRDANKARGIFSTYAVSDAKTVFWQQIDAGIAYAKRRSMWDLLFMSLSRRRDEQMVEFILRIVIHIVSNVSISLAVGCVTFLFAVWSVILSYTSNPVQALAFFGMSALAVISFMLTWFAGLYTVAATGTYVVCKAAANGLLTNGGGGQVPRQRVDNYGHRHFQ